MAAATSGSADNDRHDCRECLSTVVHTYGNELLLREDYFPLTLALSPIGGEGKDGTDLRSLPSQKTGT